MKYNLQQIRPKGQPIKTHAQLSENDRTDTCDNIQATFEAIIKKIGQSSHNDTKTLSIELKVNNE